jgi:DNA-binding MurR/RpiR family transcriptional regulator
MVAAMPSESLVERLRIAAGELSPQLRRAARFLVDRSDYAAIASMREVAGRCGVTPATMVRLAQALGFPGYPELKRGLLDQVMPAGLAYARRAADLQRTGSLDQVYAGSFAMQVDNLEATSRANGAGLMQDCAEALERAPRVWIVGVRSLFPLAFHLHYVWGFFRRDLVLATSAGGMLDNAIFGIEPADALIAMTVAPYARDTVRAAEMAHDAGATVIALTDSTVSPLAPFADHVLVSATDTNAFFHSLTAAAAVIETLIAVLAHRAGPKALESIRRTEQCLADIGAYIEPPRKHP